MKIKITLITLFCAALTLLNAQMPQGFNYQAVIRNATDYPILNTPVRIRFTIAEGATNAVIYTESQSTVTNKFGLASLIIGKGTVESGAFSNVNWATPKKLIVGIDPTGGTNYSLTSTNDLQSVPYSLSAQTAVTAQSATTATTAVNAQNLINSVLTINSSTQKIGIGNAAPAGKLTIDHDDDGPATSSIGPSVLLRTTRTADYSRIRMMNTNRIGKLWDIAGYNAPLAADSRLGFYYSDANNIGFNVITLTGSGKVGIGNDSPTGKLTIDHDDDGAASPSLLVRTTRASDFTRIRMSNTNSIVGKMWDIAALNAPLAANSRLSFWYSDANNIGKDMLTIVGNGNVVIAGSLTQNSDASLKKNIHILNNAMPSLLQISGYRYNWIEATRDTKTQIGLIAQEVEKIFPELVSIDDKGIRGVNYIGLIPVVVTAIKEQQQQIEDLKKEVTELKTAVKSLMGKR